MLACVCLNPSFDRTVSLCSFTAGDVNRVLSARQDVGGKGINVAITARRLGIASCVLGCAGKNGIDAVRRKLDGEQVAHVFLPVDGDVRTNMKIVPQDGTGVTELNEPGAPRSTRRSRRAYSDLLAEKDSCRAVCRPGRVAAAGMSAGVLPRPDALPAGAPVCAVYVQLARRRWRGWRRVRSSSSRTEVNCKPP